MTQENAFITAAEAWGFAVEQVAGVGGTAVYEPRDFKLAWQQSGDNYTVVTSHADGSSPGPTVTIGPDFVWRICFVRAWDALTAPTA